MLKKDKLIVAAISKDPIESALKAKELGADVIEMRIDLMDSKPDEVIHEIKKIGLPIIITARLKEEGGLWNESEELRLKTLISLIPFSDAVDIELCASKKNIIVKEAKKHNKTVIISTHDFKKTPPSSMMAQIINESHEAGGDIAKLAVMPQTLADVLRLFEITLNAKGAVCTIAMGEIGKHSRIIAPIYGSVLTYGYVGIKTAPGQLRVDELKSLFNILV